MKDKIIVVTGGLGFIGQHLVNSILETKPAKVIIIDDLSNGDRNKLQELLSRSDIEFLKHDVSKVLPGFDYPIDYVFHLAALVSVPDSFKDTLRTHEVNETGFINVLNFCLRHKVKKLIYASSCAVYGESENLPLDESENVSPTSPYGLTKLNNERYAHFYHQAHKLNSVGLRFFNVFGPGQKADSAYAGVISIFMDRAIKGERATIYGDGNQKRDFVFVGDVARALLASAESDVSLGVFNVGTGVPTSINDLSKEIACAIGYKASPQYAPTRMGDVLVSLANVDKIEREIGFRPKVSLSDGITALYKSFVAKNS